MLDVLNTLDHEVFMAKALEVAESAFKVKEVPIGAVFLHVPTRSILSSSHNLTNLTKNATRHAEMVSIDEIQRDHSYEIFKECVLYVTIEPCIMCASALRELGILAVFFGAWNEKFGGNGGVLEMHKGAYSSTGGIFRKESIILLRKFYIQVNEKAPNPKDKKNRILKPVEDLKI